MSARPELRALTSVRGIAAWLVVLYHIRLSIAGLPDWGERLLAKGYLAVDFFFLLSGFVIWLTYAERLRSGGLAAIPEFLRRRIARIWPLHLVVLTGAVALALLLAATGRHDPRDYPFAELPLHLLLIQNWGFTGDLAWNDPAWSISAEFGAYLAFPLLVLAIDWRRVPAPAIVAAIAALAVLLDAVMRVAGHATLGEEIARLGLVRCLIGFAMGTAVCGLWLRWRDTPALPALGATLIAAILIAGWLAGWLAEPLAVPFAFAAGLLALALTSGHRANPIEGRALHYLGEISYATYLSHFMLWVVFKLAFVTDAGAVPLPLILAYLALVLGASAGLYHWVERPAQRWINALKLPRARARPAQRA